MNTFEQKFIGGCIVKRMQERLLFELNGKKRKDGIGRFSHNADDLILPEKIILKGSNISKEDIISDIGSSRLSEQCYIIAFDPTIDKMECTVSKALELVLGNGMPAIIITDSFAVVETEQCFGTPLRYIVSMS